MQRKQELMLWYHPLFYTSNCCWIINSLTKNYSFFPMQVLAASRSFLSSRQQTSERAVVLADHLQDRASAGFYLGPGRPTGRGRTVQAQVKHSRCEQACRTTPVGSQILNLPGSLGHSRNHLTWQKGNLHLWLFNWNLSNMPVTQNGLLGRAFNRWLFSLMRQTLKYEAAPWGVVEKQTCLFWKVVSG